MGGKKRGEGQGCTQAHRNQLPIHLRSDAGKQRRLAGIYETYSKKKSQQGIFMKNLMMKKKKKLKKNFILYHLVAAAAAAQNNLPTHLECTGSFDRSASRAWKSMTNKKATLY